MTTHIDLALFETLVERIEVAATTSGGTANLAGWITKNTSHPLHPRQPFSFAEHEFQLGLIGVQRPRTYIRKASQLGVSEVMVRAVMALLAKCSGRHAIYTLPSAQFARKFAPSRFDPVVAASERLKRLVDRELNNNEVKKFGASYLYISGAEKESQSISTPASMLFIDELAYSNQEVIGTYNSRLGHLKEGEEIVFGFSTPLLPGSDIDAKFDSGTQKVYMCYHRGCGHWVEVDPLRHLRVPGLPVPLDQFQKEDLLRIDPDAAYLECEHCQRPIPLSDLADPACRAWVPRYPGRYTDSFDANFLVLPAIKTPAKILRDRANYRSSSKWLNFAVGVPADSADARITDAALERAYQGEGISPEQAERARFSTVVLGQDVGKIAHHAIGRKVSGALEIIHLETIRQTEDDAQACRYVANFGAYRARKGVVDAGPEFTTVKKIQARTPWQAVWGCYFQRGKGKSDLRFFELKEDDHGDNIVMTQRTKAMNLFVGEFNSGRIILPRSWHDDVTLRQHLGNMSRVTEFDNEGEEKERWVSTGPDHYFFAIFYAWLASEMLDAAPATTLPASLGLASTVKMKV